MPAYLYEGKCYCVSLLYPDSEGMPFNVRNATRLRTHRALSKNYHLETHNSPCERLSSDPTQSQAMEEELDRALDLMDQVCSVPSTTMYLSLLKKCSKKKSLHHAKRVQSHLAAHNLELTEFLGDHLVITLVKCGGLDDASQLFHRLPRRSVFSWTAMISGFADCGHGIEALKMHQYMQEDDVEPDRYTFVSLFKACGSLRNLDRGKNLHDEARRKGFTTNVFVCTALVTMYGKCGGIVEAENVFSGLSQHNMDAVPWNAMLSAYVEQGEGEKALQAYRQMQEEGISPNEQTFVAALQACGILAEEESTVESQSSRVMALEIGQALHAEAQRKGFTSNVFIGTTLVSMYGKCGTVVEVEHVFNGLSQSNIVPWNALLSAYAEHRQGKKALLSYIQMQEAGMNPNQKTFVVALQACGSLVEEECIVMEGQCTKLMLLEIVQALHSEVLRKGFTSDAFVGTTLVSMYGRYGTIVEAETVFSGLSQWDTVSWNTMLAAYVEQGCGERALQLYRQMQEEGVNSDRQTFIIALQACGALSEMEDTTVVLGPSIKVVFLDLVKALHADSRRKGFASDTFVGTTLVSAYRKHGAIAEAECVFGGLSQPSIVSWNAMLSAYAEWGQGETALQLYAQMQKESANLDDITLLSVLQACSQARSMDICLQLHFDVVSAGHDLIPFLPSTLTHAYRSCASMVDAQAVFHGLPQPNVVSWNTCIAGYAEEGDCVTSLQMFKEMLAVGTKPDGITFASLLSACSNAGLIDIGVKYFDTMGRDYNLTPELKHYVDMVDLFGRSGYFHGVEHMLQSMPMQADQSIWSCLLGACHTHGNVELGKYAFDHALHLQSKEGATLVSMSSIYADAGLLEIWANRVYSSSLNEGA